MSSAKRSKPQISWEFAENVCKLRKLCGALVGKKTAKGRLNSITQGEFGTLLGSALSPIDGSTVGHWETEGRVPEGATRQRIIELCDVEETDLIRGKVEQLGPYNQVWELWVERGMEEKSRKKSQKNKQEDVASRAASSDG